MNDPRLHARLMEEARNYNPAEHIRGILTPFRDVLFVWWTKSMSYEQIAAALSTRGLKVSPSGVGAFCRRTFATADLVRERRRLEDEAHPGPGATAPSFWGLSAVAPPKPGLSAANRGPKIARDNQ